MRALVALPLVLTACVQTATTGPTQEPPTASPPAAPTPAEIVLPRPTPHPFARPWQEWGCFSAIGSRPDAIDALGHELHGWTTDLTRRCVPLSEIEPGGPDRDGIPPIDRPRFEPPHLADGWLEPQEPVIALVNGDAARAYPLKILLWHEIVNDSVGGLPVAVTYCPLCDSALVFDRRVGDLELTFGTTGLLRRSDLVMWDRQTESWWQQIPGEAIVGTLTGERLLRVESQVLSYEEFKKAFPRGEVLSKDGANEEAKAKTGAGRPYGRNPYVGYDRPDSWVLFAAPLDGRLPPKTRVVVATFTSPHVAYPTTDLQFTVAAHDAIGGRPVVLFYLGGVASALDTRETADGADFGQVGLFDRRVDGRALTFRGDGRVFVDAETGTRWSVLGLGMDGPLKGRRLERLAHETTFWFAWAAFRPDTEVRVPKP